MFPSSFRGALWWQSSQIENLKAILERIEREYNVDENRVYLFGVSDGGTGAYYHAVKAPTPWAAFFPFLGHPGVLENPATGVDGLLFLENLVNRAFFVVNGEKDELYPISRVKPYLDSFEQAGVELVFHPQPGGHNTRWWNSEAGSDRCLRREPSRAIRSPTDSGLGDRAHGSLQPDSLARHRRARGRSFVGEGDSGPKRQPVEVETRGVARYRLLISPRQFDLSRPIEVSTNGVSSYAGTVERSAETLLRWTTRDRDRTMLFAAEIPIVVPKVP